ncbi:Galactose oxidase/kelch, beta-propeller [Sesbania bispinosa]|nr:Galactose oxidase/kelch, beta-propeller [Sesbania bispinosa]
MKRNSRRGQRNMKEKIPHLSQELITEILLRVPVKSLVRFKCVCKSWFSLISDPHFATSHFQLGAAPPTHRIVFIAPETHSIDLDASLNDDSASAAINLNFLLPQSVIYNNVGGSCRGFILLDCYPNSYIWNPSTGVHKQIPRSPITANMDINFATYLYGFGYDSSQDDYLAVLASYDPTLVDCVIHLEFFSLRANKWDEIKGFNLPYMNASDDPRVGSFLNGAIHWVAFRHDISLNVILAFDLMERSLFEVPLLENFDHELDPTYCDLWVFGGFLSLWVMGNTTVDIWVMEENRVKSSWTKTLVLSIHNIPTQYFSPICLTKNGDIVGTDGNTGLVKYDNKGQLLEHRSFWDDRHRSEVAMYTETLLSIPGHV